MTQTTQKSVLAIFLNNVNVCPILSPQTTYIIRTLRIREFTPFCMVECPKSYCTSCRIQSFQNAPRCTNSVSKRAFILHKSQLSIFVLLRKHFTLYCSVFGQSVCGSYTNSGVLIYCAILSFYTCIWLTQPFLVKL